MVHARSVQAPEEVSERPRERPPAGPPPHGVGLREDRLPAPVGGQRPRHLAGDEEALPEDAAAADLDGGERLGCGKASRVEGLYRAPGAPGR